MRGCAVQRAADFADGAAEGGGGLGARLFQGPLAGAGLVELAKLFDSQVRHVAQDMGQLGDTRLFLMGALLLADELADAKARLASLEGEAAKTAGERERIEARAVAALEAAAQKIEKLAAE